MSYRSRPPNKPRPRPVGAPRPPGRPRVTANGDSCAHESGGCAVLAVLFLAAVTLTAGGVPLLASYLLM